MDIYTFLPFYLNHLSPLQGYFVTFFPITLYVQLYVRIYINLYNVHTPVRAPGELWLVRIIEGPHHIQSYSQHLTT